MPTAERLSALIAGATKGPWHAADRGIGWEVHHGNPAGCYGRSGVWGCTSINDEFRDTMLCCDASLIVALANIREELADWAESRETPRSALGYGENCARADAALLAALARELPEEKP